MVISEIQNRGRGQYGKKWISYKGNLFVSFFFRLNSSFYGIESFFLELGVLNAIEGVTTGNLDCTLNP